MRRPFALLIAVVAVASAIPVLGLGTGSIDRPASVLSEAERLPGPVGPAVDVVTIYNSGALRSDVAERAQAAVAAAGGTSAIGRSASIGMPRVRRGAALVQQAPSGFAYPMGTTMLPVHLVATLMGNDVAGMLSTTEVVMSQRTAERRGARSGDVIDLVDIGGAVRSFTITVVPDAITGGTELLLSLEAADRLGIGRLSRIVLWGFDSRASIDAELARQGLVSTSVRIRRSWDPPDPDGTIGMSQTKDVFGEFAYRVNEDGSVTLDSAWRNANITSGSIFQLRLFSGCHRVARIALENAMAEVVAVGLENTINYEHANTAGGCYNARFSRLAPNSTIGFLSRHSWGMAIDTNTVGSCQGCAPPDLDCRTVRIFRKHGFAWGGNFLRPDGMHFEWVGERRDIGLYPSRFCPNIVAASFSQLDSETERDTLFADDGLYAGHD